MARDLFHQVVLSDTRKAALQQPFVDQLTQIGFDGGLPSPG